MAKVLVADDEPDFLKAITIRLKAAGHEVQCVEDGQALLEACAEDKPDVIVLDVMMPNLDGFKLLEMINQKGIETPVIFMTAQPDEEKEIKGFELGAADYLKKPIQKDILLSRVKGVLDKFSKREAQRP